MIEQCKCKADKTTGTITVNCCNVCGKPTEDWFCSKINDNSNSLSDNVNILNEAKILELEAKLWDYKTIIFNQERMIDEYKLLLMKENNDLQKCKNKSADRL